MITDKTQYRRRRSGFIYKKTPSGDIVSARSKKGGTYYLQYSVNGKRFRVSLRTSNRNL